MADGTICKIIRQNIYFPLYFQTPLVYTLRNDGPTRGYGLEIAKGFGMRKVLVELSDELLAAIDAARDGVPRNPWLERQLWRLKVVRDGAATAGVENPHRPLEGRGGDRTHAEED